ncbi:unnamed protein product [Parascedosporium putredinis]|uniref:Uncharacterized protein n=1 Tax=Parascedosporium putredinis TaxID=1442378 RepID=A0A9P1HBT8_9PEZI|nr:unnamed protein product [Parascedosporium putredinis]CAI8004095.1 unnamed protein product [Parascedosporium putredinis]
MSIPDGSDGFGEQMNDANPNRPAVVSQGKCSWHRRAAAQQRIAPSTEPDWSLHFRMQLRLIAHRLGKLKPDAPSLPAWSFGDASLFDWLSL